jgi:tetratricopeptide (TPR) repeat protein
VNRLEQLNAFLLESPNDPFLHYAIAKEYEKEKNTQEALRKYLWLTANHPGYVATYLHLGNLLIEQGEKEAALAWFNQGIEQAKAAKELHSLSELQSAKLALEYDED